MRAFACFALLAAVGGCSNNGDSLVVVDLTADAPISGVAALAVTASATASNKSATFRIAPPGGASTFDIDGGGQTFGIDLPKGLGGPLHVHVDAFDGNETMMASGDGDTSIKQGGRVDLPLTLMVIGGTSNDMGDDGGSDMGPSTGGPALTADRAMQSFGKVTVDQASAAVSIAVTNTGDQPSSALTFTPSGANLDQFALNSDCGAVLLPNKSCHVNATFKPTSAGDKQAHFVVAAAMGGMVAVDLSGTGTPPGTLTITADQPTNGDCGATLIGATSATVATYTVKNVGTSATGAPTLSTSDSMQFVATGCAVSALQPNDTCTVSVQFAAKHHGQQTASVSVTASPGGTANASASGFGQNPASFNVTSTSGFDFGSAAVGTSGGMLTLTATNVGDVTSPTLAATSLAGANPTSFTIVSDQCNTAAVAAGASCDVTVRFTPQAQGGQQATLDVRSASATLGSATLTGMGTAPGTLSISADPPANGDCGSVVIGGTSATSATYTVKNIGTSATGVPSVSTSDNTQFAATGCAAALMPNATCTVTVTFTAKHHGTQTASVSVTASPGGTANASVTGFGQNPASFAITSTSGFDFGSAATGTNGQTLTFTATNQGDVTSPQLAASSLTGTNYTSFAITSDACSAATVAPNGTCSVSVRFSPQMQGPLSATLNVRSSSATLGSASLSGTGTAPGTLAISADSPANGNCGSAVIGSTSATTATYTVKNIGTSATGMPTISTSDTTQFIASGCAVSSLAPNATCSVSVQFKPKHAGAQNATVSATASPGGTANASVTGTGLNPASFSFTSASGFDFGSVQRTTASTTITVTATNQGDVASPTLTASQFNGDGSFAVTVDGCVGKAVAAGASCTVTTQMTPKTTGPQSATLTVNAGTTVLGSQTMTGTGTPTWVREYSSAAAATDLQAVWATTDGMGHDLAWAVGDSGVIISRGTNGTWSAETALNINGDGFVAVRGSGPTDLWAIDGTNPYIYRSTGDGTWRNTTTHAPSAALALYDIYVFGPSNVFVTGIESSGMLTSPYYYVYQYDQTSNQFTNEEADGCRRLWGTSALDLFCAYNYVHNNTGTSGLRNRIAGAPWPTDGAQISTGTLSVYSYTTRISGSSPSDIYVGVGDNSTANQRPYHWNGSALTAVSTTAQHGATAIWEADSTHVYFGGAFGVQVGNGSTWSTAVDPLGKSLDVMDIFGLSANDVFAVGHDNDGMCVYHYY